MNFDFWVFFFWKYYEDILFIKYLFTLVMLFYFIIFFSQKWLQGKWTVLPI